MLCMRSFTQRKGLGRRLMHEALRHARERALPEVWIGVMVDNTGAQDRYERLGFRFMREEPFIMGATSVAHRIGCKALAPGGAPSPPFAPQPTFALTAVIPASYNPSQQHVPSDS